MFNVKLEDINFERIEAFCGQEVPECETIEYKKEIRNNEKLAKTISAMANTYGGIILVGVEADQKKNIPIKILGIEFVKGLEEKVTGICWRSIYPPVFPKVKVCDFKDNEGSQKVIVFIRVNESNQLHTINNKTDVYLRVKSQSEKFERKATIDEIDWLKNRREKAVEFREHLLNRARSRYNSKAGSFFDILNLYREIYMIPLFPHKMLFSYENFFDILKKVENEVLEDGFKQLTNIIALQSKSAADSLYMFETKESESKSLESISYEEYNIYGLVYRKESFWEVLYNDKRETFDVKSFLSILYYVLKLGLSLYKTLEFDGVVKIGVQVKGLLGRKIEWVAKDIYSRFWGQNDLDNYFAFEETMLRNDLECKLDELLLNIYKRFLWNVGVKHIEEFKNSMVGEINIVKKSFKN